MMRLALCLLTGAFLFEGSQAAARLDPLRPLANEALRPAVVLGLDVSRSADAQALGKLLPALQSSAELTLIVGKPGRPETLLAATRAHFRERASTDPTSSCRARALLLVSDGANSAQRSVAAQLYHLFAVNPIRTYVITTPGLVAAQLGALDEIADLGDDGKRNDSAYAWTARDESGLAARLHELLSTAFANELATGGATLTTSSASVIADNLALLPSTEYPSWRGHLRALDLTRRPEEAGFVRWDAGRLLAQRGWRTRRLYMESRSKAVVPLLDSAGKVAVAEIKAAWPGTAPPDAELVALARWLAGEGRPWPLAPLLHTSPAVVGPPPLRPALPGHDVFERTHGARQRLLYVSTSDGLLHAFAVEDGEEVFAFLAAQPWPQRLALFRQVRATHPPWLLPSAPRVEDLPHADRWGTYLVQHLDAKESKLLALEVTAPADCSTGSCVLNEPPVHMASLPCSLDESEASPAMFWQASGGRLEGMVAGGVAVQRSDGARELVALYRADGLGRLTRSGAGQLKASVALLDASSGAGPQHPFTFPPAAILRAAGPNRAKVTLAAASGAFLSGGAVSSVSRLYLRTEEHGHVLAEDRFTCPVDQLCSAACYGGAPVPQGCSAPSSRARPIGSPLLLENQGPGRLEAFWLYQDFPPAACEGQHVALGTSWLIRIATRSNAPPQLVEIKRYLNTLAAGMSLASGGGDIALAVSHGTAAASATVETLSGQPLGERALRRLVVESWREVH